MTATGHAVIGTVIAAKIGNPALAIPIALASHVAADLFPHWDTGVNRHKKTRMKFFLESLVDVICGSIISLLLLKLFFPQTGIIYTAVIVFFASLPDIMTAPYLFLNINVPPFSWAYKLQKSFDNGQDTMVGKAGQVGVLVLLVLAALII